MNRNLFNLWERYSWGERTKHQDIENMFKGRLEKDAGFGGVRGIYFIGCGDRIVYIGLSVHIPNRSIESLEKIYHQIDDINLPWSIGLAPVTNDVEPYPFNELESTAIRKFAPIFNTSIPSKLKSMGREPEIIHIARVFEDQEKNCIAFELKNLEKQAKEANNNPSPPWQQSNKDEVKT